MRRSICAQWFCFASISALFVAGSYGQSESESKLARPVLALLTQVEGNVSVVSADRSRASPAVVLQALVKEHRLKLEPGAQAALLCVNGTVLRIHKTIEITADLCRTKTARAATSSGGLELVFGNLELVGEARGSGSEASRPVLIHPRCPIDESLRRGCSQVLDHAPMIQWLEVQGAVRYRFELTGPRRFERQELAASQVVCSENAWFADRRLCSLPWPAESWVLSLGREHRLEIIAVTESGPPSRSSKTLLIPLSRQRAGLVNQALESVKLMRFDSATEALTEAAIYTGSGLQNEAVVRLQSAVATASSPTLELALSDAYLSIALLGPATLGFESVAQLNPGNPALVGVAELGLGRVAMSLGQKTLALTYLRSAETHLDRAGLLPQQAVVGRLLRKIQSEPR